MEVAEVLTYYGGHSLEVWVIAVAVDLVGEAASAVVLEAEAVVASADLVAVALVGAAPAVGGNQSGCP